MTKKRNVHLYLGHARIVLGHVDLFLVPVASR